MSGRRPFVALIWLACILLTLSAVSAATSLPQPSAAQANTLSFPSKLVHLPNRAQAMQEATPQPLAAGAWTPLGGPSYNGGFVSAVAHQGSAWFAAVNDAGTWERGPTTIYRQTATTWEPVLMSDYRVLALVSTGVNLIAGAATPDESGVGLYLSFDGGDTWLVDNLDRGGALPALATHGGTVLAAGAQRQGINNRLAGKITVSYDGGATWLILPLEPAADDRDFIFTAAAIDPLNTSNMVVAGHWMDNDDSVAYGSADHGATWSEMAVIPGAHVKSLLYHPTTAHRLYAGTGGSPFTWGPAFVYRSDDSGANWTQVNGAAGGLLAFSAPSTIYACADWGQLYRSAGHGDAGTWEEMGGMPGCGAFALQGSQFWAGSWEQGVWVSADGYAWQPNNDGLTSLMRLVDIDVDPLNLDKLFVAGQCSGGRRSSNGGATWQEPDGLSGCMFSFAIRPNQPNTVFGGGEDNTRGAILRSTNGGLNFAVAYTAPFIQPDGSGGSEHIHAIAIAPGNNNIVYAVGRDNPNYSGDQAIALVSQNNGVGWANRLTLPVQSWFEAVAVSAQNSNLVYVAGSACDQDGCPGVLYRSLDGGLNWSQVLTTDNTITSIVFDPAGDDRVYIANRNYEVWRSLDSGANWDVIRANWLPPEYPPSGWVLVADPYLADRIYLGGWGYIAETPDGGDTWSPWQAPVNAGTPRIEPSALAVDRGALEQTLYAGFTGLWSHTRLAPQVGDRYVTTGGDDELNACIDPTDPCATVNHALSVANPGETIYIAAGTYLENVVVDRSVTLQGGYTDDFSDMADAPTILDGSAIPFIPGDWDGDLVRYPYVIEDGGYKMYYNGNAGLGLATSPDGLVWTRHPANPLLTPGAPGAWDSGNFESPTVIKEGPVNYKMWFSGFPGCAIGYATSPDGVNWTPYPGNPILTPGSDAWNSQCVLHPTVLHEGGLYKMWLLVVGDGGEGTFAYATSPNGIDWTFAPGNPVFDYSDLAWGAGGLWRPLVRHYGMLYEMWYSGWEDGGKMGYATSPDGLNWTDYGGNPILTGTPGGWDDGFAVDPAVGLNGPTLTLYYDNGLDIGAATSPDSINWTKIGGEPLFTRATPTQYGQPVVWIGDQLTVYLRDLTLTGGQGQWAGGVQVDGDSEVTIERCLIHGNLAEGSGDAWGSGGVLQGVGALTIADSWILDNHINQSGAGAVRLGDQATLEMINVLVAGNSGDIAVHLNGSGSLTNVTIADNPDVPGLLFGADASQALTVWDSVIWGNGAGIIHDGDGALTVTYSDVQDGVWAGTGNISADPLFAGGGDYHLTTGSPAIDSGQNHVGPYSDHDLDQLPRPRDGDIDGVDTTDMGAYEWQPFSVRLPIIFRD